MEEDGGSHRCTRFLYFTWKVFTCLFTHVMLVTLVVGYCMLGAVTFSNLESENEKMVRENISYMRGNLTEELWSYSQAQPVFHQVNWTLYVMKKLKTFENDLVLAMRKSGWDGTEGEGVQQWTLTGALFYSIIVITTIGYGHIAPKTYLGKVTTIFYAIVGIPLMLLCLSNIGDIMAHSFRFIYWRVCCYSCTKAEAQSRQNSRRKQRTSYGYDRNGARDLTPVPYRGPPGAVLRQQYPQGADPEDWEMVYEDEHRLSRREISRSRPRSRHLQAPEVNKDNMQMSVLYNKYAIDDDINKGGKFGMNKEEADPELHSKQRNLGNPARRHMSQEHLNTSPRIMSPMGFIVPRQNQPKMKEYYDYSEDSISNPIKPVPIWLCVFLVVSYIVGGAVLFSGWEDWSYADSAYFCFITLTTIGFGDFVPAQRVNDTNGQISIALCSLYLLFGIALLAMSFNLVQEEVITNVKTVARHLGIIKDEGEMDE